MPTLEQIFIVPKNSAHGKVPEEGPTQSGTIESPMLMGVQTQPSIASVVSQEPEHRGPWRSVRETVRRCLEQRGATCPKHGWEQRWEQGHNAEEMPGSEAGLLDGAYTHLQSSRCFIAPQPTHHPWGIVNCLITTNFQVWFLEQTRLFPCVAQPLMHQHGPGRHHFPSSNNMC